MAESAEKVIGHIEDLRQFLSESTNEELEAILKYWEEMKKEWERKKKEFWGKRPDRECFFWLLEYSKIHMDEIQSKYKYLDKMDGIERKKFIKDYLQDDMLYSGETVVWPDWKKLFYKDFKKWNVVLEKWMELHFAHEKRTLSLEWVESVSHLTLNEWVLLTLSYNELWDKVAEYISKMELKEWVSLLLRANKIWYEWAKAIAEHLKLKEWVSIDLSENRIWAEWAKVIAENMELEDWVELHFGRNQIWAEWARAIAENLKLKNYVDLELEFNHIWDEWVKAIMEKMELKEWVKLNLLWNNISKGMEGRLKEWEESYHKKWINCTVEV